MRKLKTLLRFLMMAQDNVTHLNGLGPQHEVATRQAINRRDDICNEIADHVCTILAERDEARAQVEYFIAELEYTRSEVERLRAELDRTSTFLHVHGQLPPPPEEAP